MSHDLPNSLRHSILGHSILESLLRNENVVSTSKNLLKTETELFP